MEKIRKVCAAVEAANCGLGNCLEGLAPTAELIVQTGCAREFMAVLDCGLGVDPNPWCTGSPDVCIPQIEALDSCMGPKNCSLSYDVDGSCAAACGNWTAECQPGPPETTYLICRCTTGGRNGPEFIVGSSCQSQDWPRSLEAMCAL